MLRRNPFPKQTIETSPRHLARITRAGCIGAAASLLLLGSAHGQPAPGFVYENSAEFHTAGDFNQDGETDLLVLDKATGQFRIAEGRSDGTVKWREHPGNSGVSPATGLSTGPLLDPEYDQLLVSGTFPNRINLIDARKDRQLTEPQRIPNTLFGPKIVTAINIPGGPSDFEQAYFDIAFHETLSDTQGPNVLRFFRNDGSGLPFPDDAEGDASSAPPRRANRIRLQAGDPPAYGVLGAVSGNASEFRLLDPSDALDSELDALKGLPGGVDYVYADFDEDDRAEFLFYTPGTSDLIETDWLGASLAPPKGFDYPAAIAEIRVIASAGSPELLVIRSDREQADRVAYGGGTGFAIEETFAATGNQPIRGALSTSEHLHLLDGDSSSASLRTFAFDGDGHHTLDDKQSLTPLRDPQSGANVLLFDAPPLQDPDAQLLGRYAAGPWTSAFRLQGSSADVQTEHFEGTQAGLGNPRMETFNTLPAGTGGGLINQLADDNSIFFEEDAVGPVTATLSVDPPSGSYDQAFRPTFELQGAGEIYYRTSNRVKTWTPVSGNPPLILQDTTLYAFAVAGQNQLSNIVKVDYTITGDPGTRDANGDGVPDFAALENGLDPLESSNDPDGDGFTNLQEILAGTDPTDGTDRPNRSSVSFEYPNSFDLLASPAIPDPDSPTSRLRAFSENHPEPATGMAVHQPGGRLLGSSPTRDTGDLPNPAARFEALDVLQDELFLIISTEPNFPVDEGGNARDFGRQLAGIVRLPELAYDPFEYAGFGNNGGFSDRTAETAAWRTAALAYFNSLKRPQVTRDPLGPIDTLELLLVEHILGQRLAAEGFADRSGLSLTPFRKAESPLDPIPVGDPLPATAPEPDRNRQVTGPFLADRVQALGSNNAPIFATADIIETVRTELTSERTEGIRKLKVLANRLYATSATTSPGALRQPLPALRQFIRLGGLGGTGYDDAPIRNDFSAALLNKAAQGVADIAAAVTPRTPKTVTLYVEGNEAGATCPTWKEVLFADGFDPDAPTFTGTEFALRDGQGDPYPVARAFPLTVGSVFKVTGYERAATPCGDTALEVISCPELAFLRNASAADENGNLIPDAVEERNPGKPLEPFADADGDGYTNLQEILESSDPQNGGIVPMDGGSPAEVTEVTPPQLEVDSLGPNAAAIKFDFPAQYVPFVAFELYRADTLEAAFSPTGNIANHTGSGNHEQVINQSGDAAFYIFRMQLK